MNEIRNDQHIQELRTVSVSLMKCNRNHKDREKTHKENIVS